MTNTAKVRSELLDETASMERQGYRLVEVYSVHVPGVERPYKIRIEVRWDTYVKQSFAAVSVLSTDLKWTHLAALPPSEWHGHAAGFYGEPKPDPATELGWVAANLLERAELILA